LSSPANWQRTRHGNSFKNGNSLETLQNNTPSRPDTLEAVGIAAPRLR
jgi:hypothetical protein